MIRTVLGEYPNPYRAITKMAQEKYTVECTDFNGMVEVMQEILRESFPEQWDKDVCMISEIICVFAHVDSVLPIDPDEIEWDDKIWQEVEEGIDTIRFPSIITYIWMEGLIYRVLKGANTLNPTIAQLRIALVGFTLVNFKEN